MNRAVVFLFVCIAFKAYEVSCHLEGKENKVAGKKCTITRHPNYSCQLERGVDKQIQMELEAFYFYLRMGNFFAHENYYLPGLSKFLLDSSQEELKHAQKMIEFQTKRGAYVQFFNLNAKKISTVAVKDSWPNATIALQEVLDLEYEVTKSIEKLHSSAGDFKDIHLQDFLESNFIPEQYDSLKQVSDYLRTLKRLTNEEGNKALAEFQFDKLVLQGKQ